MPLGAMNFRWDAIHKVVTAEFTENVLQTDADVVAWRQAVEAQLARFNPPVDLLINLDGLVIKPAATRAFGKQRAALLAKMARRSFRFGGDPQTVMAVHTSAVIHGAGDNVYSSRDTALAALLADRKARGE